MPVMALRVFLLDDHEVVRSGLRSLLETAEDMEVVGEAGTVEEALTERRRLGREAPRRQRHRGLSRDPIDLPGHCLCDVDVVRR
jgi:hypothetical protein